MRKQGRLIIHNRPLVKYLVDNDYLVKSNASADKILSTIPEKFQHYFFRGLIDGDGVPPSFQKIYDGKKVKTSPRVLIADNPDLVFPKDMILDGSNFTIPKDAVLDEKSPTAPDILAKLKD